MNYNSTIKSLEKNYDKKVVVKLKDMKKRFKDSSTMKNNPIVYEVFIKNFMPVNLGLTVLYPGNINGEFYITRGHIHKKPTPEFYILLEGSGLLLIQKDNVSKTIELNKGQLTLIPRGYAHRLINIGNKKLKVLTIYDCASMPSYKVKFKKKFFKR